MVHEPLVAGNWNAPSSTTAAFDDDPRGYYDHRPMRIAGDVARMGW